MNEPGETAGTPGAVTVRQERARSVAQLIRLHEEEVQDIERKAKSGFHAPGRATPRLLVPSQPPSSARVAGTVRSPRSPHSPHSPTCVLLPSTLPAFVQKSEVPQQAKQESEPEPQPQAQPELEPQPEIQPQQPQLELQPEQQPEPQPQQPEPQPEPQLQETEASTEQTENASAVMREAVPEAEEPETEEEEAHEVTKEEEREETDEQPKEQQQEKEGEEKEQDVNTVTALEQEISQLTSENETTTRELELELELGTAAEAAAADAARTLQSRNCCAVCGRRVLLGAYYDLGEGRRAHVECFCCARCGAALTTFRCVDGAFVCAACAHALRPPAQCAACGRAVADGEPVVALGREWHAACFCCAHCGRGLRDAFAELHGRAYCPPREAPCYRIARGMVCTVCGGVLDSSYLTVINRCCHRACFCCSGCGAPFPSLEFFQVDSQPFCETCAVQIFTAQLRAPATAGEGATP